MPTPTATKSKQAIPSSPASQNSRLFTDTDEIRLLKTFYKITKSNPSSSPPSASPSSSSITVDSHTFERIDKALNSKFTHSQITDKLRRLRVKYRKQARSRSLIKTPHDQEIFNLTRKLWGKKTKPKEKKVEDSDSASASASSEDNSGEDDEAAVATGNEQGGREEEVDLKEYPALVSELSKYSAVNSVGLKLLGSRKLREMNAQWMSIGIEEAKIVTKKAELVKEQTRLLMQVLQNGSGH